MNKQKRKEIETELSILINSALGKKNEMAAAATSKQIKVGVKDIAKKFVKNLEAQSKRLEKSGKTKLKKVSGNSGPQKKQGAANTVKTNPSKKAPLRTVKKPKSGTPTSKRGKPTTSKK